MFRKNSVKLGISELLAITIGIAITIAIGVMLYMFMPNLMSSVTQQQKIALSILSANAVDEKSAIISIAIRNLGTKAINEVNVTILNQNIKILNVLTPNLGSYILNATSSVLFNLSSTPLAPGQEISIVITVEGTPIISGTKINIVAMARFVDDTISATTTSSTIL